MVLNNDKALVSGLTKAKDENERRAAITSIAQSVGNDIKDYMTRSGLSYDFTSVEAGMNAKVGEALVSLVLQLTAQHQWVV
jgi:uncharacterized protein with GYD domain